MKIFILIWLILAPLANAQPKDLHLSGFGTLGVISSDSKEYGHRTNLDQSDGSFNNTPDYVNSSVLGLQLDYTLRKNTDLVFQSVYHNQHTLSLDSTTRLAFARFTANPAWSFRLGRTPVDLFLLTEYRDVGFGITWAHTPSEVYSLVPYRYLDGMDITHSTHINHLNLRSKLFVGTSTSDLASYQGRDSLKLNDVTGISISLATFQWSLQYRYTSARAAINPLSTEILVSGIETLAASIPGFESIWPNSSDTISRMRLVGKTVNYSSLGGKYDWQSWSALAEVSRISTSANFKTVTAGYASVIFHSQTYSLYGIYAATHTHAFDMDTLGVDEATLASIPGGTELYTGVAETLNFYTTNQATWSLGLRWNLSTKIALKCQWDQTRIEAQGGVLWLNKNFDTQPKETVNTLFTNVSFIF